MIKSRLRLVLILLACAIVVTGLYFLFTRVIWENEANGGKNQDPPIVLANGEYYIPAAGISAVYPYLDTTKITTLTVYDREAKAPFTIAKTTMNNKESFRLKGYEGLNLQNNLLSVLQTYAAMPQYSARVTDGTNTDTIVYQNGQSRPITLKQYGLDAQSDPTYFNVTLSDGTSHTLFLGNATPAGNGFYARYVDANGVARKEVYVVSVLYSYFTLPKESLLTPTVVQTNASQNVPYLPTLSILENGDPNGNNLNFEAKLLLENYGASTGDLYSLTTNGRTYGGNLSVFTRICSDFISLSGNRVACVLPTLGENESRDPETIAYVWEKYGIKIGTNAQENRYVLQYRLKVPENENDTSWLFPLLFSDLQKNENGESIYYVYTTVLGEDGVLYEQIVEVPSATFAYLEQDSSYFVEPTVYSNAINQIQSIAYQGAFRNENGILTAFDEIFYLTHIASEPQEGEEAKNYFTVNCQKSGYQYFAGKTDNFSLLYLLTIYNPRYIGNVTAQELENKEWVGKITITATDGTINTYDYYRVSSCKMAVSVNGGACEFSVSALAMNELFSNVNRAAVGQHSIVRVTSQLASTPGFEAK